MNYNDNIMLTEMDLTNLSKQLLLEECEKLGITKCKSKNKTELIELIEKYKGSTNITIVDNAVTNDVSVSSFKFIDLFCGIGGFHQALTNMNGKCVFACDIDEKCRNIYEKNYKLKPDGDITKINISQIPNFDVLCGGFPCQPFSKAGLQKGFDDDRGNLFFNICNIIKHHKPKYMILENVRNLASHDDGNTWKTIYKNITELGYTTYETPIILNVLHFNVPQNRERVVILCKRNDLGELPVLPIINKTPKQHLTNFIANVIENDTDETSHKLTGKMKDVHNVWNSFITILTENNIEMPKFPIWTDWWDNVLDLNNPFYAKYTSWIDKNQCFYKTNITILETWLVTSRQNANWFGAVRKFEWQAGNLNETNNSLDKCLWSARGSGIRVKKCDYIPTLVAMSMIPIYGPKNRKLTPRELLRLQSFPDTFMYDSKTIHKQVGNAVNVKMIEQCARFLLFDEPLL